MSSRRGPILRGKKSDQARWRGPPPRGDTTTHPLLPHHSWQKPQREREEGGPGASRRRVRKGGAQEAKKWRKEGVPRVWRSWRRGGAQEA